MSLLGIIGLVIYVAIAMWMARGVASYIYYVRPGDRPRRSGEFKPGYLGTAVLVGLTYGAAWPIGFAMLFLTTLLMGELGVPKWVKRIGHLIVGKNPNHIL